MSLDQRCQQFHEAALGTGKSKGPVKEIATLRKFLHKNQDQRFSDKAVSRLFDSIQLYTNKEGLEREHKEGLLEDALKMPFTVFSTKQKKSMLKWLEDIRGEGGGEATKVGATSSPNTQTLSVIDLTEKNQLSLMHDDTGDVYEEVNLPTGDLGTQIKTSFDTTDGTISVEVEMDGSNVHKILRQVTD